MNTQVEFSISLMFVIRSVEEERHGFWTERSCLISSIRKMVKEKIRADNVRSLRTGSHVLIVISYVFVWFGSWVEHLQS